MLRHIFSLSFSFYWSPFGNRPAPVKRGKDVIALLTLLNSNLKYLRIFNKSVTPCLYGSQKVLAYLKVVFAHLKVVFML